MKMDDRIMDRRRRERMNEALKSERMGRGFLACLVFDGGVVAGRGSAGVCGGIWFDYAAI